MKRMKYVIATILVCTMALFLVACGTQDEEAEGPVVTLIYTHYQPGTIDQPKHAAALAFQAFVEKHTNGAIEVQIFPNSELGDGPSVLESMQANTIHMTVIHDGPVSAFYAPLGIFNIPFLFDSHAEAWTIYDGEFTARLGEAMLDATGLRLLGMADNGIRHITNSLHPIHTLEDLEGMAIRIQPAAIYREIFQNLGANPIEVAWAELPAALQQGVADGQENSLTNILAANLYETQRYMTLNAHVYSFHAYLISDEFYTALTPEQQSVIREGVQIAKWIHRGMASFQDNTVEQVLVPMGVQVVTPTPEEMLRFREAAQPATIEWLRGDVGSYWVDGLFAELDRIRQ